ncbi:MAG: hypothetical protein IJI38_09865, partial [Clostridia bacterium]|nr:hypothetical protein [Clostridia bacterium]
GSASDSGSRAPLVIAAAGSKLFVELNATFMFVEVNATAVLHLLCQLTIFRIFLFSDCHPVKSPVSTSARR